MQKYSTCEPITSEILYTLGHARRESRLTYVHTINIIFRMSGERAIISFHIILKSMTPARVQPSLSTSKTDDNTARAPRAFTEVWDPWTRVFTSDRSIGSRTQVFTSHRSMGSLDTSVHQYRAARALTRSCQSNHCYRLLHFFSETKCQ